jgi:uncharacterized OsmC-like protein
MGERSFREIIERNQKALRLRPSIGRGTATTTVRVRSGVTCDIEDGPWKLIADESEGDGGAGLGPDSGVFGRAAIGSCLALGYVMWADYLGIPLEGLGVVVEADYNAAAMLAVEDSPPGWGAVRVIANISSPAPEEDVRRLFDFANRYSPLLDDFTRALPVSTELRVTAPAKE